MFRGLEESWCLDRAFQARSFQLLGLNDDC